MKKGGMSLMDFIILNYKGNGGDMTPEEVREIVVDYIATLDLPGTYVTRSLADNTYLSKADATNIYLSKDDANNTYATRGAVEELQDKVGSLDLMLPAFRHDITLKIDDGSNMVNIVFHLCDNIKGAYTKTTLNISSDLISAEGVIDIDAGSYWNGWSHNFEPKCVRYDAVNSRFYAYANRDKTGDNDYMSSGTGYTVADVVTPIRNIAKQVSQNTTLKADRDDVKTLQTSIDTTNDTVTALEERTSVLEHISLSFGVSSMTLQQCQGNNTSSTRSLAGQRVVGKAKSVVKGTLPIHYETAIGYTSASTSSGTASTQVGFLLVEDIGQDMSSYNVDFAPPTILEDIRNNWNSQGFVVVIDDSIDRRTDGIEKIFTCDTTFTALKPSTDYYLVECVSMSFGGYVGNGGYTLDSYMTLRTS